MHHTQRFHIEQVTTSKFYKVGNDHLSSRRGLLQVVATPLLPRATLTRDGVSSASLSLTWNQGDWDTIEAVVVDGVLEKCSVDNSAWRNSGGIGTSFSFSSCFKLCTELTNGGGIGRGCLRMKVGLGSVYDLLVSRRADPAKTRAVRVKAPWVHNAGRCLVSEGAASVCGDSSIAWHGGLMQIGGQTQMASQGDPITSINSTMGSSGISFSTNKARASNDMTDLVYLSLDRGMRITRIVTVTNSATLQLQG